MAHSLGWWQCCEMKHTSCSSETVNVYACLLFLGSREACNEGEGDPPLYVNVNMFTGQLMNTWIDSLQAFFPGLQVNFPSVKDQTIQQRGVRKALSNPRL